MAAIGKYSSAPTLDDIQAIASEAFATIPDDLAQHVADVAIYVTDFPDDETLEALELESPFDLLGLYQGISLDQKSVADTPTDIDRIFLYRRPLLDYWCDTGEDLYHVIRHVLIHEIGHHFGFSDDDMEAIEARPAS